MHHVLRLDSPSPWRAQVGLPFISLRLDIWYYPRLSNYFSTAITIQVISTCMEPINILFLGFIFCAFLNVTPPKMIFEDRPPVVNFSIFVICFSLKMTAPNLRPEDFKELLAAIFKLMLELSAWIFCGSMGSSSSLSLNKAVLGFDIFSCVSCASNTFWETKGSS